MVGSTTGLVGYFIYIHAWKYVFSSNISSLGPPAEVYGRLPVFRQIQQSIVLYGCGQKRTDNSDKIYINDNLGKCEWN